MSTDSSITGSVAGLSKWLTAGPFIFTALLGTTWMIGSGETPPKLSSAVVVGAQHVPSDAARERNHVLRMRAPLHDFFGIEIGTDEETPPPTLYSWLFPPSTYPAPDIWALHEKLRESLNSFDMEFMIMTVADPIDSVNNSFFDHQLDALQKALVANPHDRWLYSGGYLPWQAFKDQRSADPKVPLLRKKHWYQDEPGVLLFHKEDPSDQQNTVSKGSPKSDHLLLVYLIGEMPTLGVQRDALDHAIHEIATLSKVAQKEPGTQTKSVAVVGPTFTGSAYSLKKGLIAGHSKAAGQIAASGYECDLNLRVINGSATAIRDNYFHGSGLEFLGQTVCDWRVSYEALKHVAGSRPIAWLTETGTGLSSAVGVSPRDIDLHIPVPLGISRVRGAFEKQLTAAKQQSIGMPLVQSTSPLPFDADETAHDMPPVQTPQMTAASVELLIHQIIRSITSKGIHFVGLLATDVRDTIFLAEMLKLHCPQVQLLVCEADILLTHPGYSDSLRGAIVASSYPLFIEGLEACRRGPSLPVMGGPSHYGIYNAILLQRGMATGSMTIPTDHVTTAIRLNDSPIPYLAGLSQIRDLDRHIGSTIWLHTVGYDRFYPQGTICRTNLDVTYAPLLIDIPAAEAGTQYHFRLNPVWFPLGVSLVLVWAAILLCRINGRSFGDLFDPLLQQSPFMPNLWQIIFGLGVTLLAIISMGTAIVLWVGCPLLSPRDQLAWLTESHFFSGVTLLLPLFCASAAGIAMSYMKLRQAFLISPARTKEINATRQQQKVFNRLWLGWSGPFSIISVYCLLFGLSVLAWCFYVIFWSTIDASGKPVLFWMTWITIAIGYFLWLLCAVELIAFQRQLRRRAKAFRNSPTKACPKTLAELHRREMNGVYRLLFGSGPRLRDPVGQCRDQCDYRFSSRTLDAFREIQYRLVIIKNQFYLLAMGAVLLFCAVVAYPFTSSMMLRSLATVTIIALAGGVCLCFWKLERDEALSEILGTKPNEIDLNVNNLSVFVSYGLIAVLVLVSQFVPGAWMTLGRMFGPILHLGH